MIKKIKAVKPKIKPERLKQTGTSDPVRDAARSAKKLGYRISASGKKYFEARRNRSDKRGSRI